MISVIDILEAAQYNKKQGREFPENMEIAAGAKCGNTSQPCYQVE